MKCCKWIVFVIFVLLYGLIVFRYLTKKPGTETQQTTQEKQTDSQPTDMIITDTTE